MLRSVTHSRHRFLHLEYVLRGLLLLLCCIHAILKLKFMFSLDVIVYVSIIERELCAILLLVKHNWNDLSNQFLLKMKRYRKKSSIILIAIPHAVCFRTEAEFVVCSIILSSQIVVRLFLLHCANYVTKRH